MKERIGTPRDFEQFASFLGEQKKRMRANMSHSRVVPLTQALEVRALERLQQEATLEGVLRTLKKVGIRVERT